MPSLNTKNAILSNAILVDSSYNVGIGGASSAGIPLKNTKKLTGASNTFANYADGQIQTDATGLSHYFYSEANIIANAAPTGIYHFKASQGTFGSGSSLTVQAGLVIDVSLSGAGTNYGIISNINAATNNWNLYIGGSAKNWIASSLGIGSGTQTPAATLDVNGTGKFSGGLTGTTADFTTNDNNFAFNVKLRNTSAGTQALTGFGLSDSGDTRKGQVLWVPSNYVTTSLQNSFLVSSVTNVPLILCADATGAATPNIKFQSGATDRMVLVGSSGNLGIGTSSPAYRLHVSSTTPEVMRLQGTSGGGSNNTQLRFFGSGSNADLWAIGTEVSTGTSDRAFDFYDLVAGANRLRITSGGELLIGGTYNPTPSSGRGNITLNGTSNNIISFTNNSSLKGYIFHDGTDLEILNAVSTGVLRFYTNSTERMRITSGGNVGIGTSSPAMSLQIGNGTGTGNQYIRLFNSASDMYIGQTGSNLFGAGNGQVIVTDSTYTSNFAIGTLNSSANLIFGTSSAERMRITSSGNVQISNTLTSPSIVGKLYNQTSTTGSTSIVDTFIDNNAFGQSSLYLISYGGNPNAGGSGAYKANYVGYISVITGFIGGAVKRYIQYSPTAQFDASGVGNLVLSVFFFNGTTETTTINEGSTSGYYIRLKITGYNTSFVGAEQYVYLTKVN